MAKIDAKHDLIAEQYRKIIKEAMPFPQAEPFIESLTRLLCDARADGVRAGYRRGIEDAAKVANDAAAEYSASSKQIGDYHHAKVVAANSIAAAIRDLGKAEEGTAPR